MKQKIYYTLFCIACACSHVFAQSDSITQPGSKFSFGGYGEMLYQYMDYGPDRYNNPSGAPKDSRATIDLPRVVWLFGYNFTKDLKLESEVEFEHTGTGSALELEYEEFGEYEMEIEKAGEVMLEEFFLTRSFSDAFKIHIGHMVVPVGLNNSNHNPVDYFTTFRPEGQSSIIPTTWHETGIAISGEFTKFSYEIQLLNGLDANGFSSAYWVKRGKQGIFETTKMTNPAFVTRLEYEPKYGLKLGASVYAGNSAGNTQKPENMEHINGLVSIGSFDVQYDYKGFLCKANGIYGTLGDAAEITKINKGVSKNIQYPRTPVASAAATYAVEIGYNISRAFTWGNSLFFFGRYDYYNSMQKTSQLVLADARFKREVVTFGVNYSVYPNVRLKADYSTRIIDSGNYNTEHTFGLALVYSSLFVEN